MEQLNDEIKTIIEERKKRDSELFFITPIVVSSKFNIGVIKRKSYFGVLFDAEMVLLPIYDDVVVVAESVVALKINGKYSLYDITDGKIITDFYYIAIEAVGAYWKLFGESGEFIVYDTLNKKIIYASGVYEEYNLKCIATEYCWAKRGNFFDYIHRVSGRCISLPGILMAYDTEFGMFGMNNENVVIYFDEYGYKDNLKLRKLVFEAGGYLTLNNYTYNIQHIIDVYGNILNV